MHGSSVRIILCVSCMAMLGRLWSSDSPAVGVVTQIKVVSDKVPDISSMEAWKKAYSKEGMTDREKAMAVWQTVATFQHQDFCPLEGLQSTNGGYVADALKQFHVYGYNACGAAAIHCIELARYIGLEARGSTINVHVVPEIKWDNAWHLLDASLIVYFPKADKQIASIEEIIGGVKEWYAAHPEFLHKNKKDKMTGDDAKLRAFHKAENWKGWKRGPDILVDCPTYDDNGMVPAATHGWYTQMQEFDGSVHFYFEQAFSQGYQVNVQLRKGERVTRNWFNKGFANAVFKDAAVIPSCLKGKVGEGPMAYSAKMFKDLAPGRIGNGTHEYDVPLATGEFRAGALAVDNLAAQAEDQKTPALHIKDAAAPGSIVIRMPSSYVYHTGSARMKAVVGQGGAILVQFSDNNGLDWKDLTTLTDSGEKAVDLTPSIQLRYDYRLKFIFKGSGTGLDALKITHDIQHSQRPLPALDQGENKIAFSAGKESTITIESALEKIFRGKQVLLTDFHPTVSGTMNLESYPMVKDGKGELTLPVETPGDMTRIRFGFSGRVRNASDKWNLQVSFDDGKTFKTVETVTGPAVFTSKWVTCSEVPTATRKALVRYAGEGYPVIFSMRIDADYIEPRGGFQPIKVTYVWEENGQRKEDVHIAKGADEQYTITCGEKPIMKSISLEWAE